MVYLANGSAQAELTHFLIFQVHIKVEDVNDEPPVFVFSEFRVETTESETVPGRVSKRKLDAVLIVNYPSTACALWMYVEVKRAVVVLQYWVKILVIVLVLYH